MKKLRLMHHIAHLEENSLANEIFNEERRLGIPGLWQECKDYLKELSIPLEDFFHSSKNQWKKRTEVKIKDYNERDLLNEIKGYKKLKYDELIDEGCEMREYFKLYTLKDARTKFAMDTKMLPSVKSHFPSEKCFMDNLLKCEKCERIDTISHIKICPGYENLREGKDMDQEINVIHYFQEVLKSRMEFDTK